MYIVFLGIWHYDYKELIAISYVGADIPASLCPKSSYRLSSTAKDSTCVRSSSPTSVSEDEEESDPLRRRRGEGKESSDLLAYRNVSVLLLLLPSICQFNLYSPPSPGNLAGIPTEQEEISIQKIVASSNLQS